MSTQKTELELARERLAAAEVRRGFCTGPMATEAQAEIDAAKLAVLEAEKAETASK